MLWWSRRSSGRWDLHGLMLPLCYEPDGTPSKHSGAILLLRNSSITFGLRGRCGRVDMVRHRGDQRMSRNDGVLFLFKVIDSQHKVLLQRTNNNKYSHTSVQSWKDENTAKPAFLKKLIRAMDILENQKAIFMFSNTCFVPTIHRNPFKIGSGNH